MLERKPFYRRCNLRPFRRKRRQSVRGKSVRWQGLERIEREGAEHEEAEGEG